MFGRVARIGRVGELRLTHPSQETFLKASRLRHTQCSVLSAYRYINRRFPGQRSQRQQDAGPSSVDQSRTRRPACTSPSSGPSASAGIVPPLVQAVLHQLMGLTRQSGFAVTLKPVVTAVERSLANLGK